MPQNLSEVMTPEIKFLLCWNVNGLPVKRILSIRFGKIRKIRFPEMFSTLNDGPLQDGTQLGPFYELESLSPAALLAPGKALTHLQITYHLQGDENALSKISKQILGVDLREIENVFKQ